MRRREFLKGAGFGGLSLALTGCRKKPATSKSINKGRPNIVFILSDDLGWGQCGYQGGELVDTFNIDKLALGGAVLNQFYVQPVCTPTRSALLTGRYPFRTGTVIRFSKNDKAGMLLDERTLAEALKEAGYYTAIVGKWHLGHWQKEHLPMQRGFGYQYGQYGGVIDYFTHRREGILDWHRNEEPLEQEGYSTYLIASEAERLIKQHDETQPLFLYVPFNAVHGPQQAPSEKVDKYKNRLLRAGLVANKRRAAYAGQLECMDEAIGKILEAIKDRGMRDNTLIVFSNDNGGTRLVWNRPLRGRKSSYYEGGIRVPAIVNWPGKIQANTFVEDMIHICDFYPTLINLASGSLEQELPIDGVNVWDAIAKGGGEGRDEIVHGLNCIRQGKWKYIDGEAKYYNWAAKESQLYNIEEDPYEENNLIDKRADIAEKLKKKLKYYAGQSRESEEHEPIPDYPPAVYGEQENKIYKSQQG